MGQILWLAPCYSQPPPPEDFTPPYGFLGLRFLQATKETTIRNVSKGGKPNKKKINPPFMVSKIHTKLSINEESASLFHE